MKITSVIMLVTLASTSVFAASPKASTCLSILDPKNCLASAAAAALAAETSSESRTNGYASLISSMAKAGVRRDDVFFAANDDEAASIYSRWSLAVARRMYALHFGMSDAALDSPQRIEALADLLRARRDGLERMMVVSAACEAREGESAVEVAKWDGTLDRLCRLDETDVDALDSGIPGLSALAAPVVDAYNHDELSLRRSIAVSLGVLAEYEKAVDQKMAAPDREAIFGALAIGHLLNATALAISGYRAEAAKAIGISLGYIAKAPALRKSSEYEMVLTQASWIYAKAGMRDEAMGSLRKSLAHVDGGRNFSDGEKVTAIATGIETLGALESVLEQERTSNQ